MTPSAAHAAIRARYGRGSRQDTEACILLAHGRFADVIARAAALPAPLRIVA